MTTTHSMSMCQAPDCIDGSGRATSSAWGMLLCSSCFERERIRHHLEEHRLRVLIDQDPEDRAYLDGAIDASEPPRRPPRRRRPAGDRVGSFNYTLRRGAK